MPSSGAPSRSVMLSLLAARRDSSHDVRKRSRTVFCGVSVRSWNSAVRFERPRWIDHRSRKLGPNNATKSN